MYEYVCVVVLAVVCGFVVDADADGSERGDTRPQHDTTRHDRRATTDRTDPTVDDWKSGVE